MQFENELFTPEGTPLPPNEVDWSSPFLSMMSALELPCQPLTDELEASSSVVPDFQMCLSLSFSAMERNCEYLALRETYISFNYREPEVARLFTSLDATCGGKARIITGGIPVSRDAIQDMFANAALEVLFPVDECFVEGPCTSGENCPSGYCSPNSKMCRPSKKEGEYCNRVQTCGSGLQCIENQCKSGRAGTASRPTERGRRLLQDTSGAAFFDSRPGTSEDTEDTILYMVSRSDLLQEVPPAVHLPEDPKAATALVYYTVDTVTGEVIADGSYQGLTGDATSCHIHEGPPGRDGPAMMTLSCVDGIVSGSGVLDTEGEEFAKLLDYNAYLNIHTAANLPGEIRGQISEAGTYYFTSFSDAEQEVPPAINGDTSAGTATAYWTLYDNGTITVDGTYSGLTGEPTSCHLHDGLRGTTGNALVTLSCVGGGVSGSGELDSTMVDKVKLGATYLNIHTALNLPGEIRGQVEDGTM